MAEQHPTIIVGHLKDDELKQSINALVAHFQNKLQEMVTSTNTAVDTIQKKLKSIGDTKIEFPKSRGDKTQSGERTSSSKATAEIEREIKARKELKITLDQEILGRQKASGKNVVIQQYDEQIEKLKKRLVEVRKDIDIFNYAIGSGKKTQVEWGQTGLKQANAEAERLMRTIAAMEHQRGNLARVTEPQGHQIQNYVNSLKTANPELQRLNEQYRRGQSLLQNQSAAERQAAEGTKKYTAEIIAQANAIRESERWKRGETVWMTNEGNVKLSQTIPLEQQLVDLQYMGRRIVFETAEAQEKVAENVNKTKQAYSEAASAAKRVKENASIPTFTIPLESSRKLSEKLKELREQYSKLNYGQRHSDFGKSIAEQIRAITRQTQILNQELNRPTRKEIAGLSETTLDNIAYKINQLQAYKRGINITDPKQAQEIKDVDREINRLQKDLNSYMATTRQASQINNALTRSWNYMKNRLAFYFTVGASTQFVRNLIEIRSQYEMNERALGILIGSAERGTQIFNELSQMSLVSPYTLIELSAAAKQLTAYDVEARNVVDTTRRLADMAAAVGIPIERLTYAIGQVKAFGYLNSRDARMFSNAGIPLVKQLSEYYTELEGKMVSTADIYDRIKKKAIGYNEVMQVMYKMTDEGGKFYDFQAKMADTLKVRLANFTLAWNNMLNDIGKSSQGFLVGGINGLTKLLRHWKDLEKIIYAVAGAYGGYKAMQILVARTVGVTARSIQMQVLAEKQHQATLLKKQALYRSLTPEETKLIMTSRMLTAADYQNILATKNMTKQKAMLLLALNKNNTELKKALIEMGLLTKAEAQNIAVSKVLSLAWKSLWISLKATAATVASLIASNWWMILIAGVASAAMAFKDASDNVKQFNDAVRSGAEENKKNIAEYLKSMENLRSQLTTKDENGRVVNTDISDSEAEKAWESMREQIELSSAASASFVGQLMRIGNVSERLRQGFRLLDDLQKVNSALSEMDEKTLNVTQDYSKWWNLWQASDGLIDNIKDYNNVLNDVRETWGSVGKASKEASDAAADDLARLTKHSATLAKDVRKLADSINMFNANNSLTSPEQIQESYAQTIQKIINENGLSPDDAYALQVAVEEKRGEAIKEALEIRYKDELKALENVEDDKTRFALIKTIERDDAMLDYYRTTTATERAEWERFTEYLKDNHIHEMQAMFQNMDDEQLRSINWQEGKYQDFIKRSVESYAKRHKMSYDEAFDHLRKLVNNANMWEIFINLHIVAGEEKPWIDQLKEADSNLESAVTNMDRLKKTQKEIQDELRSGNPTLARRIKLNTALAKTTAAIAAEEVNAAEARDKFGISKTEEKEKSKAAKDAEKERKKQQRDALKHQREEESELQRTLKNELTLIDKIRGVYKELTKDGMSHAHAIQVATKGYEKTEQSINAVLSKWGLGQFRASDYAGITNPNELLRKLKAQLERINATGRAKPAEIKDFEVKIKELVVDAEKYNLTKITKGLNTELDKLKDEYELAVEIDANPELGNAFAEMFGINVDELPHTFAELFERANKVIKDNVRKLGVDVLDLDGFDILRTPLKPENRKWNGIDSDSSAFQELTKWQNTFREMFKKNMTETENMLDEYVKKYGDFSDKIAEIESDRLDKIRKLNEAYFTEEMRKRPDYLSKLNAIEQGSQREKGNAAFEEFKNSRLYVEMFENLEYVSTTTLEAMREKLENLKSELGSLSPEQLKSVIQQFEKIDNELISRNPFKGLIKGAKDYAKAVGKQGKKAQEDFRVAQRKYDFELGTLATMKEQLEQVKAEHPMQEERIKQLEEEITEQEGIVAKRREELEIAAELNEQYNLMRRLFGEQAQAVEKVISTIASNLQSLSELRDILQQTFGVDLGSNLNATIDGLAKVGNGLSQIVSSAQSANVVGGVSGAVNTVYGIGDAVASIFGKGSAKTKKLDKQIAKSAKAVTELNNAYKALERSVDKSLGKAETEARRLAIANKEAELAELQRQLTLEKRKRKKDEDSDAIAEYESRIQDLKYEIEDLKDTLVSELLGSDIKSAAEGFVDAWVGAWREGETTLDAIEQKMDEMIMNLIKKAATSAIVSKILKPLYDAVDQYTSEASEGGVEMTQNEIAALAALSKQLGVDIDVALGAYYKNLERIGAVSQTVDESKSLSALQAGIQGITEETAGALEAYMNSVSQQVYLHSDLLTQIRDAVVAFDLDVSTATISQILLQLQSSYQVQMSINNILSGVLTPNGRSFSVELAS